MNKFSGENLIRFKHHGGCVTVATTAEMGLRYWYVIEMNGFPNPSIPPEAMGKICLVVGEAVNIPQEDELVTLSLGALERKYGSGPEVVGRLETRCQQILNWMADQGEITWEIG